MAELRRLPLLSNKPFSRVSNKKSASGPYVGRVMWFVINEGSQEITHD